MKALIYGNGESRKNWDITKSYKGFETWGCNAIYRDCTVDNLVAIDYGVQQEIYESGYVFKNNWEVAGRFTTIMPDNTYSSNETENQYTLGVSKYIVGHKLKIQTDLSYSTLGSESNFLEYRLGFDLHF